MLIIDVKGRRGKKGALDARKRTASRKVPDSTAPTLLTQCRAIAVSMRAML
jgi:hypothetical protein